MEEKDYELTRLLKVIVYEKDDELINAVNGVASHTYAEWILEEEDVKYFLEFIEKVVDLTKYRYAIIPEWG